MKLEIALFHYETVLRPALDPLLLLQQRPALRPPPLRYLDLSAVAHRACRQVTVGLPLRRQLEPLTCVEGLPPLQLQFQAVG